MWMPLMRHQSRWPDMRAFALPSFYDGRIRVNLTGREASGQVTSDEYDAVLDEIEHQLRSSTESRTGRPVVSEIYRTPGDPLTRADDDVDMIVLWADDVLGFAHSALGTFGPLPPRRTGGHTSPTGRCIIVGPDASPGYLGVRSSFDVVPTLLSLAGGQPLARVSGRAFA
jgi:predicted AlkP superfamily phosphohydrolase/phosphomutase